MPSTFWQSSLDTLLLRRWSWALADLSSAAESVAGRELGFMEFGLLVVWSFMAKHVCAFVESGYRVVRSWVKERVGW